MSTSVEIEENCHCAHCGRTSCTVAYKDFWGHVVHTSRCDLCGYVIEFDYGCGSMDDPTITANKREGIIVVNDRFIPGSLVGAQSLAAMLRREQEPLQRYWYVAGVTGQAVQVIEDLEGAENSAEALQHANELFARVALRTDAVAGMPV